MKVKILILMTIWSGGLIGFFIATQIMLEKDRYFWCSLGKEPIEGMAILKERKVFDSRLDYYTIVLEGENDVPDFIVQHTWSEPPFNLSAIYHALSDEQIKDRVKIQWLNPVPCDAYYLTVNGVSIIESDPWEDAIWVFFSLFSALLFIFGLYRLIPLWHHKEGVG